MRLINSSFQFRCLPSSPYRSYFSSLMMRIAATPWKSTAADFRLHTDFNQTQRTFSTHRPGANRGVAWRRLQKEEAKKTRHCCKLKKSAENGERFLNHRTDTTERRKEDCRTTERRPYVAHSVVDVSHKLVVFIWMLSPFDTSCHLVSNLWFWFDFFDSRANYFRPCSYRI